MNFRVIWKMSAQDDQKGPTGERDTAGEDIASSRDWSQHPLNSRFSIRTLFSRYFVVMLAGPEQRQEEKERHPFAKRKNLWIVGSIFGGLALLLGAYTFVGVLGR